MTDLEALLRVLVPTLQRTNVATVTPEKQDDEVKSGMSPIELASNLQMCGKPSTCNIYDLPGWFQEYAVKGTIEQYKLTIIRKWVMNHTYYNDATVPLANPLLKKIM